MRYYSIGQRKKSRGNLTWYGRTFENGVLVKEESLRTTRKSDAQSWLDAMNALRFMPENLRERLDPVDRTISEAYATFMRSMETSVSPLTMTIYRSHMSGWLTWVATRNIRTLRGFTPDIAVEYFYEVSKVVSAKTTGEYMRMLRQFFGWCRTTYRMGDFDPMDGIKRPKVQKRFKKFWTPEEIDLILDAAPSAEFRLFWSLMAFAGLRHSEAYGLGTKTIVQGDSIKVIGKGSKEAFIPISDRLAEELKRCEPRERMFDSPIYKGSELSNRTLRIAVNAAGMDATDATNHKFRHSFISNIIRTNKVSAKAISELARHSTIGITMDVYGHLLQEDLRDAVNAKKEGV